MYHQKRQKRKRRAVHQRRKKQTGGFLSRYDFAYASRDVVNQAAKVAPGAIKGATSKNNNFDKR